MCKKQAGKPLILLGDPIEAAIVSALATHPSAYSTLSTVFGGRIILRSGRTSVVSFSLAVMPFVYAKMKGSEKDDLPKWVIDSLNWKNLTLLQ